MKPSAGSVFVVAVIILGLGVLAGGQIWVNTGSEIWGWTTGLMAAGVAGLGWRALARRATAVRGIRFLGESQEGLDESDFSEVEETDDIQRKRAKIERDLEISPRRVADSVRSMLVKGSGEVRAKRGSRRG